MRHLLLRASQASGVEDVESEAVAAYVRLDTDELRRRVDMVQALRQEDEQVWQVEFSFGRLWFLSSIPSAWRDTEGNPVADEDGYPAEGWENDGWVELAEWVDGDEGSDLDLATVRTEMDAMVVTYSGDVWWTASEKYGPPVEAWGISAARLLEEPA